MRIRTEEEEKGEEEEAIKVWTLRNIKLAVWAHRVIRTGDGLSWEKCRALVWPAKATGSMDEHGDNFYQRGSYQSAHSKMQ